MPNGLFESADFIAGDPVLDFANTVDRSASNPSAPNRLPEYAAFIQWASACDLLDGDEAAALGVLSERLPARAASELAAAKRFRDLLFRIFAAVAVGDAIADADLDSLRDAWRDAVAQASFGRGDLGFGLEWTVERCGLETPRLLLVAASVRLLTASDTGRLRMCAADDCARLFLDVSKSGQRRWCSMATCGNAAKARRFYRAHR